MDARERPIPSAHDAGFDAGTNAVDAHVTALADAAATGAGAYTIYPVEGECPVRPFPPGLEVHPTTLCSGRTGECHEEVCHSGADCTARPLGRCAGYFDAGAIELTRCEYEDCYSNGDCATGSICVCEAGFRRCVPAACLTNADCPTDQQCVRGDLCGQGPLGPFLCTSAADECRTNQDCVGKGNSCSARDGHLKCIEITCE